MDNHDRSTLYKTLELAGVPPSALSSLKILRFGQRSAKQNRLVHRVTNDLIMDLLVADRLRECIHVTGDMRALTDPFHRQLCEEMQRNKRGVFNVLYNIPEEYRRSPFPLVRWNLSRWTSGRLRRWDEELRIIDAISNRSVNLLAYDTLQEVQYSVFGGKFILLQEVHRAGIRTKRVWLLESAAVNSALVDRGMALIAKASAVDERLFGDFSLAVGGVIARRYLRLLSNTPLDRTALLEDSFVCDYAREPSGPLEALETMGFVHADEGGRARITNAGQEFLRSY